jgi:hypothetical protein
MGWHRGPGLSPHIPQLHTLGFGGQGLVAGRDGSRSAHFPQNLTPVRATRRPDRRRAELVSVFEGFGAGLGSRVATEVCSDQACPTPNLGSGAHAAGISEAKGAQSLGRLAAALRAAPEGA